MTKTDRMPILKNGVLHITSGQTINLLMAFLIAYSPVEWCLNAVVNRFISYGAWWDSAICLGLLLIAVFLAAGPILTKQNHISFLIYFIFLLVFGITIYIDLPGKSFAINNFWFFFGRVLPYFLVGFAISDFQGLERIMVKSTKIVVWAMLIWTLLTYTDISHAEWQNNMPMAYEFLPSLIFSVYYTIKTKFKEYKLYSCLSLIVIIALGTRGPILLAGIFIAYAIITMSSSKKRIIWVVFIGLLMVLIWFNFYSILNWLNDLFVNLGITNAAINKMLYAEDLANGRIELYEIISNNMENSWVLGQGVYCDRTFSGIYVHLLPLELVVNFGIILGGLIFTAIMFWAFWGLAKAKKNTCVFCMLAIGVFVGVFKLFMSGSYLEEPYFFLCLGLLSNRIINSRYKQKDQLENTYA